MKEHKENDAMLLTNWVWLLQSKQIYCMSSTRESEESKDSLHSPDSLFSSTHSSLVLFAVSEVMNVYVYLSFY